MKELYDLAFGVGAACSCSQTLRGAGLQYLSLPFDWIVPNIRCRAYDEDVVRRVKHICNGFDGWFRKDDFHSRGANGGDHLTNGMLDFYNERLEFQFIHDFPRTQSFDESFPVILEKYKRRIARFLELLDRSRKVLVLRIERPDLPFVTPLESFRIARELLTSKYPGTRFDFIQLVQAGGVPPEKPEITRPEDWFTSIAFDYQSKKPGEEAFPDLGLTARSLASLAAVRDYRTREEIRRHKEVLLRKKLAKAGCDTLLQLRWKKLKDSIRKRIPWASFKFE